MPRFSWLLPLLFATAAAHAQPDGRAHALQLFEESDKAYKAGDFEHAAALLRQAYAAYPEPILLYNLGRALEGMGDARAAADEYEHYLRVARRVDDRGAIERRIETLRSPLTPPPTPLPAAPPPPPPPPREELDVGATAGWVVVGAGGALLATGAVFGWRASDSHDAAIDEPVQAKAADLQHTATSDATLANVLFISGGALAIGAGIYELVHHRSLEREGLQVSITPRAVSLGWAW